MRRVASWLCPVLVSAASARPAWSADRHVAVDGADGPSCLDPLAPCRTIAHAVGLAAPGDRIVVGPGTYAENLVLDRDLTVHGAGAELTVVDGGGPARALSTVEVLFGATVRIESLTITGGYSAGNGGGVLNLGQLALERAVVRDNIVECPGVCDPDAGYGGGVYTEGDLRIVRCELTGNRANAGGGLATLAVRLEIFDSWIAGNQAIVTGGGAFVQFSDLLSFRTGFDGNGANGLYLDRSTATVWQAALTRNTHSGVFSYDSDLTLIDSTISDNATFLDGAGLRARGGARTSLHSCTVAGNVTDGRGGGIFSDGPLELDHTLVAGNTAADGPDCYATATSLGFNLIGDAAGCTLTGGSGDRIGVDPLLGPLQGNGGETETRALLAASPAIDAGDAVCPTVAGQPVVVDQRGATRPATCSGGGACDIGAFEACSSVVPSLYESPSPRLLGRRFSYVGSLSPNPYTHVPAPTPALLFYQADDGTGAPPQIEIVKAGPLLRISF